MGECNRLLVTLFFFELFITKMKVKKSIIRNISLVSVALLATACSPDEEIFHDNSKVDPAIVDAVTIMPNQKRLIADGNAQIELQHTVFTKSGTQVPDTRVDDDWIEYTSDTPGVVAGRVISIADASLVGKTVTVKARVKTTGKESDPVSFSVIASKKDQFANELVIPVVFHILQTKDDIDNYGGEFKLERIEMQLKRLNNMFSGAVSHNPVGVNTNIRFEMAQYDQYGNRLVEPGVDRKTIADGAFSKKDGSDIDSLITAERLLWSADDYLNVWLVSDRKGVVSDFANDVTAKCAPCYVKAATADAPKGLKLQEYAGQALKPSQAGIIYKLSELDVAERSFFVSNNNKKQGYNELGYYIGLFYGLLPTCNYSNTKAGTDYCDDTIDYAATSTGGNKDWYKTMDGCYFRAENIMDDPRGVHCSVSQDQTIRMRWTMNNCVGRMQWKSTFALSGK